MIRAKIEQAVGILNELDIDVWMLFARESATVHDPSFDLVVGGNCTWQSAFILTRTGERIAMDVKAGDVVLFAKYSGTEVKMDGKKLLILRESDILGIVG